ncbi:MAG: AAA family ATPase [Salibacteraceae bacterium]
MMTQETFLSEVSDLVAVDLKKDQIHALEEVYRFLFHGGSQSIFILRGYAGTGKTTLIGALIRWFHSVNRKTVLMAPTGRSAKVLASHSGYPASTIHRRIYSFKEIESGKPFMELARNTTEKTMFFVDEASMIGETNQEEGLRARSLLEDLISYVNGGERCRLILIGDDAQLPPVGMDLSPALDRKKLASISHSAIFQAQLIEVVRQARDSMILSNATLIRNQINEGAFDALKLMVSAEQDMFIIDPYDLEDRLSQLFSGDKAHESVIICRSNKDANQFNQQVRSRILYREAKIEGGDRLMIVKNNYKQNLPGNRQNFLANGDMITVDRVHAFHRFKPFEFAEVEVHFSDEPEQTFDLIVLLNSLEFEGPSIPGKELFKMRAAMIEAGQIDPNEPEEKFFQNPFFNSVQVKYAYAVTCHKSQGGQWSNVFIFQGYFTDEMMDRSYFRWLYTAVTRATDKLMLINFPPSLIVEGLN